MRGFNTQQHQAASLNRKRFQNTTAVVIDRQAAAIQGTREFMADQSQRIDLLHQRVGLLEAHHTRWPRRWQALKDWTRVRWQLVAERWREAER